jgi:phosphate transport system substrate-binding protein
MERVIGIRKVVLVVLAFALLATAAGCGQSPAAAPQPAAGEQLKGTIAISGAFALYPMMQRWTEEFTKLYPDVQFDLSAGGAGKGMTDALNGAVDIGMVSRAITPEEEGKGAFWVSCVKDAVFVTVNEENPVLQDLQKKGLSKEMLAKIYMTNEVTTWGEAVGRPEVTDPIHVYTRSDACGAADIFAKFLGGSKAVQDDLQGSAKTNIAVNADPGLLDAVVKDPLSIGFNNLNYAFDAQTGKAVAGAQVVSIDANGNGQVDPDETYTTQQAAMDAVASGKYPSPPARDENLVTNGKPTGLVLAFMNWILTDGQQYDAEAGYVPLPKDKLEEQIQKLK